MTITRPINRYPVGYYEYLKKIITQLHESGCKITTFVGDNPKRAIVREALNHASRYACEYCTSKAGRTNVIPKAETDVEKIASAISFMENMSGSSHTANLKEKHLNCLQDLKKKMSANKNKTTNVWPYTSCNGQSRTDSSTEEIVRQIESGMNDPELAKGLVGRSLFLDISYFNFTLDIPAEYMHSVCLGIVKRVIELTFTVGETRTRVSSRRLSPPTKYNQLMKEIKVPREFSRRVRNLDLSIIKAQEYRNIITVFFPVVIQCIEPQAKERRLWLLLTYMIRACVLPNPEFANVCQNQLKEISEKFYSLYEQLFGSKNCSYTVHMIGSHLQKIRGNKALTENSAFKYENFYSEVRRSFAAGTNSTLKQIFQRTLLKRALSYHSCALPIFFKANDSNMESNNIIYIFENEKYKMYKIFQVHQNLLLCNEQGYFPTSYKETPEITWKNVGVFKEGGISDEIVTINKIQVHRKVIRLCQLLITIPINILRES